MRTADTNAAWLVAHGHTRRASSEQRDGLDGRMRTLASYRFESPLGGDDSPAGTTLRGWSIVVATAPLRAYKRFVSPFLPPMCRFYPTCSEYAIAAIERFGVAKGAGKALVRILKCHPFHPGGFDPVE